MRARHQDGWIEETAAHTWKAHWYEYVKDAETGEDRRRHRSRVVGEKKDMRKFEAQQELDKILAPVNAGQTSRRDNRVSLAWFVENRWLPTVEGNWSATTHKTNSHFVRVILSKFGDTTLRDLDCAPRREGLATKSQFFTFPWGNPREAKPNPKARSNRLGAIPPTRSIIATPHRSHTSCVNSNKWLRIGCDQTGGPASYLKRSSWRGQR